VSFKQNENLTEIKFIIMRLFAG